MPHCHRSDTAVAVRSPRCQMASGARQLGLRGGIPAGGPLGLGHVPLAWYEHPVLEPWEAIWRSSRLTDSGLPESNNDLGKMLLEGGNIPPLQILLSSSAEGPMSVGQSYK